MSNIIPQITRITDAAKFVLDDSERTYRNLRPQKFATPHKPEVEEKLKEFVIGPEVLGADQWGTLPNLIEYLRLTNRIPESTNVDFERDDAKGSVIVRYRWWEVTVLGNEKLNLLPLHPGPPAA